MKDQIAILCVDDDILVLNTIKSLLEDQLSSDYIIYSALDAEEAMEVIDEILNLKYDLPVAIVDYIMPGIKGDKLMEMIHDRNPGTKNILLTGQATTDGIQNAVNKASLYRFISKPWDYDDFLMTIKEAIKTYFLEIELENERLELKKANAELRKLDQAKSYFLGLISHEINTPLFSISGYTDLIKSELEDKNMKEYIEDIDKSVTRLKRFAEYSLLSTRLISRKYELSITPITAKSIIDVSVGLSTDKLSQKSISLANDCKSNETILEIDEQLIPLALRIILENSIKFSGSGGIIKLSDCLDNAYYSLTISDSGSGFNKLSLEHAFDIFYTDELMNHQEGLGLGLALVKIIMDQHSGKVELRNNEEGGASVTLHFPV